MINEYIIMFNKGDDNYELYISAHNEEEAITLAKMQSKYSGMGKGKFNLLNIRLKGEENKFLKSIEKLCFPVDLDRLQKR